MIVNTLYYQEQDNGNVELLEEQRAQEDQAECLADQMLANVFGL